MFDFGFTRFITNTWISVIWTLFVILAALACIVAIVGGLFAVANGAMQGFGSILLAPIVIALYLLFIRIGLECIIVLFRIETHLRALCDQNENK